MSSSRFWWGLTTFLYLVGVAVNGALSVLFVLMGALLMVDGSVLVGLGTLTLAALLFSSNPLIFISVQKWLKNKEKEQVEEAKE